MRHLLLILTLIGCGSSGSGDDIAAVDAAPSDQRLPPLDGMLDYQLGGAYAPRAGVQIVSRDRTAAIAPSLYNICYVNGFQVQPDETMFWMTQHPELILRDGGGNPVIDTQWNEMLLDVSKADKRTAIAAIIRTYIEGCKAAGFDAIEIDNLDSYTRSGGRLTADNAVAAMRLMADVAHSKTMAIAQKNSADLARRRAELGTDFAVSEECNRYSECDVYRAAYGDHVLVIEYRRQDFMTGCAAYPGLSIVLRDLNLVPPTTAGYVYEGC